MSFDFRYSKLKSDGYVDYASSDNQSMQFTANYFTRKGRIKANVILGEQHTGISWWGVDEATLDTNRTYNPAGQYVTPSGENRYYENQTDNYWQNHYHLVYSTNLSERLLLNAAVFYVDGRGYYEQFKQDQALADYYLPDIVVENDTITQTDLVRQKWLDNGFLRRRLLPDLFTGSAEVDRWRWFKQVCGGSLWKNHLDEVCRRYGKGP